MKVKIDDIKAKMTQVLTSKGYTDKDTSFLIDMYLGGELRGHISHGLASFIGFTKKNLTEAEKPVILKETNATFFIDAKSNSGTLIGKWAADEAIKRAKNEIVGTSIIKCMGSWLRPGAIAQYIANQGFVAVVTNSGGGAAVAPPGGYDPVTGTNPIAYGVPTDEGPLVVDMATAKRAWGEVRLANKYGTNLPDDTFYDPEGNITTNPKNANSEMSFGEYKGFSLSLFVEMLCGSMVGMEMMVTSSAGDKFGQRMPDRGAFILVIDPEQTVGLSDFKHSNTALITQIKASHPLDNQKIRIPGDKASTLQAERIKEGYVDIPDELWKEISDL